MQALLGFLQGAQVPSQRRGNVCDEPVRSITVGAVPLRRGGLGVSRGTSAYRGELAARLLALLRDEGIAGDAPDCFTSICLNVDFAASPHVDRANVGESWILGLGDYEGGELWVEGDGEELFSGMRGSRHDIRHRWHKFNGQRVHATCPYDGYRVSVVFFTLPAAGRVSLVLRSLGFRAPSQIPLGAPPAYRVFICSTRRAQGLVRDTLPALFADGSVPPSAVTLCLRDGEDVARYGDLPLDVLVGPHQDAGLPAQRRACLAGRPEGSWNLFLDDDIRSFALADAGRTLNELFTHAFLLAEHAGVKLWGLNTSANEWNLRGTTSRAPGLVNGYCYGVIQGAQPVPLPHSDAHCGAAEDVERSLRYYADGGILRLNWACAQARVRSNAGGLQHQFASRAERAAAHDAVVRLLCAEFPALLVAKPGAPNGCVFRRGAERAVTSGDGDPSDASDVSDAPSEGGVSDAPSEGGRVSLSRARPASEAARSDSGDDAYERRPLSARSASESVAAPRPACAPSRRRVAAACVYCSRVFARPQSLAHHIAYEHSEQPPPKHECPRCGRLFRQKKDALAHLRGQRCGTRRGKHRAEFARVADS